MILDFQDIPLRTLEHFKGGEKQLLARMYDDEGGKILLGTLVPGASIGLHTHDDSSETMYFLKGKGKVLYDGTPEYVYAGAVHHCPKGHAHCLVNDGDEDLVFLGVVPKQ